MKALNLMRASVVAFALALIAMPLAYSQQRSSVQIPAPGTTGPSLGDTNTNLSTIAQGLQNNNFANAFSYTTLTVSAGATTSTILQYGMNFLTAAVGTTATVILPTAKPGTEIFIANNTGQGVAIFGSTSPFTPGGIDYINNVAGNTVAATPPYAIPTGKNAVQCFVPQGGNWWCASGS